MRSARLSEWRLIRFLDNWKTWVLIAYLGLASFGIWLYQTRSATSDVIAQRKADARANALTQYTSCLRSIPILRESQRFVRGVQEVHNVLVENAVATHRATPPGTAVYRAQVRNLRRLRIAALDVQGLSFHPPTIAKCKALRARFEARP